MKVRGPAARLQLSRDFREIVKIVLDRSQFNRIISHTTKLQEILDLFVSLGELLDGAFVLIYSALSTR